MGCAGKNYGGTYSSASVRDSHPVPLAGRYYPPTFRRLNGNQTKNNGGEGSCFGPRLPLPAPCPRFKRDMEARGAERPVLKAGLTLLMQKEHSGTAAATKYLAWDVVRGSGYHCGRAASSGSA
ncbi:hypothetical protein GCM10022408_23410 [Hymenobacter fastidiosus]|uniref:Uncharacterized protein n=1 Tax=Hymenobacter fastidiosus TaxID=486264 RepID=A0ABP7SDQ4_9BACT